MLSCSRLVVTSCHEGPMCTARAAFCHFVPSSAACDGSTHLWQARGCTSLSAGAQLVSCQGLTLLGIEGCEAALLDRHAGVGFKGGQHDGSPMGTGVLHQGLEGRVLGQACMQALAHHKVRVQQQQHLPAAAAVRTAGVGWLWPSNGPQLLMLACGCKTVAEPAEQ